LLQAFRKGAELHLREALLAPERTRVRRHSGWLISHGGWYCSSSRQKRRWRLHACQELLPCLHLLGWKWLRQWELLLLLPLLRC